MIPARAVLIASLLFLGSVRFSCAQQQDDSADAAAGFFIDKLETIIHFAADGTGERSRALRVKLESDAAVRSLGVLAFSFDSDSEQLAVDYVRVRKPDGTVVETPQSNIQETASPVTSMAPMYSDLRVKQIPVKGLANGDWLEYRIRWIETKPMIPNQFWYEHDFTKDAEVKEETLTIRVPSGKYIKLSNPGAEPEVHEENGDRIYLWKTANSAPTEKKGRPTLAKAEHEEAKKTDGPPKHSVEMTTFRTWEEVGSWYARLSADKVAVTPAIQAKADELTKDLTSADAKEHALYDYVSTRFRYISVSFGEGRYQPHSAAEVLANLYGDCKDKHTLLASLLNAAGIEASAVLIGSGLPFNPGIPSPAQFNHVITMIPGGGREIWLDATPEVAPFGLIEKDLRDHEALVVPPSGAPHVVTTPVAAVLANSESAQFKGSLDAEGTLKGHLEFSIRGDAELILRSAFHETPPTRWPELAQQLSEGMGYSGTVSGVDIDNPQDTSKPFHYGWDYKREKYADWANLRIVAPLPGMGLPELGDDPPDDFQLGDPGEMHYDATLKLPAGYSVDIPGPVHQTAAFAEFQASYSVADSVLETHRAFTIRKAKVTAKDHAEYKTFSTAVNANLNQFIVLARAGEGANVVVSENNARAEQLIQQALASLQRGNTNSARDSLSQAKLLNPKQRNLWAVYSILYGMTNEPDSAVHSIRTEIELHPGEPQMYRALAEMETRYNHKAEAEAALREVLKIVPEDEEASRQLGGLLIANREFDEAISTLDKARKAAPDNVAIEGLRVQALLAAGRKEEGVSAARAIGSRTLDANGFNSVAYELAEAGVDLKLAGEYADRSITMLEDGLKDVRLSTLTPDQVHDTYTLALVWDTAGWIDFLNGNLTKAEKRLEAAWKLSQHGVVADHLAQVYEKEGKNDDAVHLWRLSLATGDKSEGVSERLQKLTPPKIVQKDGNKTILQVNSGAASPDELGKLRTVEISDFSRPNGSAEYFVLLSGKGVEDAVFVSGKDELRGAREAITKAKFDEPFADNGPEKIARRGILSCSQYTKPNCQLVLLLPGNTTVP